MIRQCYNCNQEIETHNTIFMSCDQICCSTMCSNDLYINLSTKHLLKTPLEWYNFTNDFELSEKYHNRMKKVKSYKYVPSLEIINKLQIKKPDKCDNTFIVLPSKTNNLMNINKSIDKNKKKHSSNKINNIESTKNSICNYVNTIIGFNTISTLLILSSISKFTKLY